MTKLTKEQKTKAKAIYKEFEDDINVMESKEAVDFKTADQMPERVWACTPEIKLKATKMAFDLQLTPEQTAGGVIRIIRVGSNRIKICSMVLTKNLNDGYGEALKEAKIKKTKDK